MTIPAADDYPTTTGAASMTPTAKLIKEANGMREYLANLAAELSNHGFMSKAASVEMAGILLAHLAAALREKEAECERLQEMWADAICALAKERGVPSLNEARDQVAALAATEEK